MNIISYMIEFFVSVIMLSFFFAIATLSGSYFLTAMFYILYNFIKYILFVVFDTDEDYIINFKTNNCIDGNKIVKTGIAMVLCFPIFLCNIFVIFKIVNQKRIFIGV